MKNKIQTPQFSIQVWEGEMGGDRGKALPKLTFTEASPPGKAEVN